MPQAGHGTRWQMCVSFQGLTWRILFTTKTARIILWWQQKSRVFWTKEWSLTYVKMLVKPSFIYLAQSKCEHLHKRWCMLERVFIDLITSFKLRSLGSCSDVFRNCFSLQSAQSFCRKLKAILPKMAEMGSWLTLEIQSGNITEGNKNLNYLRANLAQLCPVFSGK